MSFAIPAKRLRETETLMAFPHPRPSHRLHILLVPKRQYASLMDLAPDASRFLRDLVETVQDLVWEFELNDADTVSSPMAVHIRTCRICISI